MGLLFRFLKQMRLWDMPTKIAFGLAAMLLLPMLLLALNGPADLNNPAWIGVAGLLLAMQLLVLWGNRHMVSPYTLAQRQALAGDFEAARETLEPVVRDAKRPDVAAMTLLGNVYRQLGDLDASEALLSDAVRLEPSYHFPLYGYGRTLMAGGQYDRAHEMLRRAQAADAPSVVLFDLGHVSYRTGDVDRATDYLKQALQQEQEAHRQLMAVFWLNQLHPQTEPAPDSALIRSGLSFWQAEADRYAGTAYGSAIQRDLHTIRLLQE